MAGVERSFRTVATHVGLRTYKAIRLFAAKRDIFLRQIYREALEGWVDLRRVTKEEELWLVYWAAPRPGENRKRLQVNVTEDVMEPLIGRAEADGRMLKDAVYSALKVFCQEHQLRKQLKEME